MNVRFACPGCERPAHLEMPRPVEWQCPHCDHPVKFPAPGVLEQLASCPLCGTDAFYKKKDFPHWLGLLILTAASLGFVMGHGFYHPWLAWSILIGAAVLDGALYLCVGDVTVCYRCAAHFRGVTADAAHKPFDLGIAERFRQERLRLEQARNHE